MPGIYAQDHSEGDVIMNDNTDRNEEAASAGVEVASVVTGEGVTAVRNMAILIAYRTWGQTGMKLARNFHPTIREWNEMAGQSLRTRAQVGEAADKMIKEIRAERDGK